MTEPNATLLADETVARIKIDGKEWPIPKLAIKQNKVILPILTKLGYGTPRILAALETEEGIDGFSTVLLAALQRAHKDMTREELENMPMGSPELQQAIVVVARQTGMYRDREAEDGPAPLAPAGETPSSPTGPA